MKIPDVYIERIRALGYPEGEARFLYTVANHSGYFVSSQFSVFTGGGAFFLMPKVG
jgi:hypothetical protein